jgi:two-component system NarL family sensor kinase
MPTFKILRIITVVFVAIILSDNTQAQTKIIDSLKQKLQSATGDDTRVKILFELCSEQYSLNPDSLLSFAYQANTIAVRKHNNQQQVLVEYYIALHYLITGFADSSLAIITQQLQRLQYATDKDIYVKFLLLKAKLFNSLNRVKESLEILFALLKEAEQKQDIPTQIGVLNRMVGAYVTLRQDQKAQELCYAIKRLLPQQSSRELLSEYCASINNLTLCFIHLYEVNENNNALLDSAFMYNTVATNANRQNEFLSGLAFALGLKGNLLGFQHRYAEGEAVLKQGIVIYKRLGNRFSIANAMAVMGNFFGISKQPLKGIKICKEGIAISKKDQPNFFLYINLAGCYKEAGNYLEYGNTMYELVNLKDSIYTKSSAQALSKLQADYDLQKKENTIIQQKLDLNHKNILFYGSLILLVFTVIVAWVIFAIRKKNQFIKLAEMQAGEKRKTTEAVLLAEETERKRIAADLHDSVAQKMVVAKLNLETLEAYLPVLSDKQQQVYNNIVSLVDESCTDLRSMSHSMMPHSFLDSGLSVAVKNFIEKIDTRNLKINFTKEGHHEEANINTLVMVYRIIQECVQNVLKHASATRLDISIIYTGKELDIAIEDNGVGFNTTLTKAGAGMQNIRSRVQFLSGTMDVQSSAGKGTAFIFYIPAKRV